MLSKFFGKIFRRNYAISQVHNIKTKTPVFNDWSLTKAVQEGYKANVWVYRAVSLIVRNVSHIPWMVKKDSVYLPDHHLSKLFSYPNPSVSKNDIWELFHSWLQLAGNSYAYKVKVNGQTQELWPLSPDRVLPEKSPDLTEWLAGYVLDKDNKKTKKEFKPEEILHLKFFNPANPLLGIGPLQAAAKVVDVDNDQTNWNKSTMQNRGVIDGVFTFEREFESIEDSDAVAENLNKKYGGSSNARKIAVLGGNAKYHRTAMTPQESDFSNARKDNRDEIFLAFGVPPQLGGSQESSTYNNYEVSILIFWFSTLIPILDDIKSEINFDFEAELGPGEEICFDLSGVKAIRKAMLDQAATAEKLFGMGVPFEQVNRIFEFNVEEFEGWETSYIRQADTAESKEDPVQSTVQKKSAQFKLVETRADDLETQIEKQSVKNQSVFYELLQEWEKIIFDAIDKNEGQDVEKKLDETKSDWFIGIETVFMESGLKFGMQIIEDQQRTAEDVLSNTLEQYLDEENYILTQYSFIAQSTVDAVLSHVVEGLAEGYSTAQLQQSIYDSGVFSEMRALRLARTITGNAANLGQLNGAKLTGATHKTWITASFGVRDSHEKMDNVKVEINDFFKVGGELARYPLDNRLTPAERVNCRCTLTYSIE